MTVTITRPARQQKPQTREEETASLRTRFADDARLGLADNCEDAADLRDLALMLGLLMVDPRSGSLIKTDPWSAEIDGPFCRSPRRG